MTRGFFKTAAHYLRAVNAENIKSWRIDLSYRTDFVRQMIQPFFYVLPYVLYGMAVAGGRTSETLRSLTGTGDVVTFIVLGYIFMGFLNTAIYAMGMSIRREQWYGTLETIFAAPVPRGVYVAGMALHSTVHQGLIISVQMVLISLIIGLTMNAWGLIPSLGIIGLMLIALYGIGILVSGLTLILKQGWIVAEILHGLISVLTPIAYPLAVMPLVMQKMSVALPTTYGISCLRHFTVGEVMPWSVSECITRLAVMSVAWVVFGLFVFLLVDRKVRRSGAVATY